MTRLHYGKVPEGPNLAEPGGIRRRRLVDPFP